MATPGLLVYFNGPSLRPSSTPDQWTRRTVWLLILLEILCALDESLGFRVER